MDILSYIPSMTLPLQQVRELLRWKSSKSFPLWIISSFAVLRLDWGIQLHNPNNPAGERWIHNFKWKNTALNFGVGYPF